MALQRRGKSKGEEGYGQGLAAIAAGDDVLLDEEAMVETLLDRIESPNYQPPSLPSVALELMNLSQQPDVDLDDVLDVLERDSMIAGRILKLVQSPVYSGEARISSLRDCLVRVGLVTLRDEVMAIVMRMRVFKSPNYAETMELLRHHSTATAQIARIVSHYSPIAGEYAFLAGLLHDVGIAGTLLALADGKAAKQQPPELVAIWPALDRVHERAAEVMADHWGLPAEIKMAIGAHHQVLIQGHPHPLAATLAIADDLAHEFGFGVVPKANAGGSLDEEFAGSHTSVDRTAAATLERAREALQLTDAQMDLIRGEAASIDPGASG